MATEKVGVCGKWHGRVSIDECGTPLPKSEWSRARPFSWAVRWFGSDGKRFSKSFKSRQEAERYAETKQVEVRVGKGNQPRAVTLTEYARMYLDLRGDLAEMTKVEHARTLRLGEVLNLTWLAELQLAAADGQEYVFVNGKGPAKGDRVKRLIIWRDFQAIREKVGLPKCSFHDLRKSYCANLAGAVRLHIVQELAGHADIRTTRKHYVKVREEQIDLARRALEEVMRS